MDLELTTDISERFHQQCIGDNVIVISRLNGMNVNVDNKKLHQIQNKY